MARRPSAGCLTSANGSSAQPPIHKTEVKTLASLTFVYSSELQPSRRLVAATPFLSPFLTVVFKLASYTLDPVGQHVGLSYCR
jgi:hypothetical protein